MEKRKLNNKRLIASLCVILFLVCYGKIAYEAGKRSVTSDRETQSTAENTGDQKDENNTAAQTEAVTSDISEDTVPDESSETAQPNPYHPFYVEQLDPANLASDHNYQDWAVCYQKFIDDKAYVKYIEEYNNSLEESDLRDPWKPEIKSSLTEVAAKVIYMNDDEIPELAICSAKNFFIFRYDTDSENDYNVELFTHKYAGVSGIRNEILYYNRQKNMMALSMYNFHAGYSYLKITKYNDSVSDEDTDYYEYSVQEGVTTEDDYDMSIAEELGVNIFYSDTYPIYVDVKYDEGWEQLQYDAPDAYWLGNPGGPYAEY